MKTVKTPAGTELPLTNLKGRDYLMVAYRIQWFNEANTNFTVHTEPVLVNDDQTIFRATISVYDKEGKPIKSATATKRETKKDFPDHTEKAETGAIGRALLMLGYGTQFALSDLDEGGRIVDAPVVDVKEAKREDKKEEPVVKKSSFRKEKKEEEKVTPPAKAEDDNGGWE